MLDFCRNSQWKTFIKHMINPIKPLLSYHFDAHIYEIAILLADQSHHKVIMSSLRCDP